MKKTLTIGIILFMGLMGEALAQANRGQLRDGNRSFKKGKYDKAEVLYRRALQNDSMDYRGQYNLGNALYRQKKYDEAVRHFDQALQSTNLSDRQRSRTLHNKGNSFLKAGMDNPQQGMQHFQQAVQSYQEALKLDPKNDDTRYNLAYARRLLQQAQQQQQNQQGQGQNQDQNNQNGQNQQNQQNKDQQNKGNQNQQNQNQQGDQKDQKDTQKRPNQMEHRKQDAERMLEAVKNNERQSLKEQTKKVQAANSHPSDKDW